MREEKRWADNIVGKKRKAEGSRPCLLALIHSASTPLPSQPRHPTLHTLLPPLHAVSTTTTSTAIRPVSLSAHHSPTTLPPSPSPPGYMSLGNGAAGKNVNEKVEWRQKLFTLLHSSVHNAEFFRKNSFRVFEMRCLITNSSTYTRVSASEGDEGKTRLSGGALQNKARSFSPLYPPEP